MPFYEYKCRCNIIHERRRPLADRDNPAECPACGENAKLKYSGFALLNSRKQWQIRKEVNYAVDNGQDVYQKQLRITANRPRPKNLTTEQWNAVLAKHKGLADTTKPILIERETDKPKETTAVVSYDKHTD